MKRMGRYGAAAALTGGLTFGGAETARAAPPSYFTGFNDGFLSLSDAGQLATALDHLKSAKGQAIRQNIDWRVVQPTQNGGYDWTRYTTLFGHLLNKDVQIIPVLHGCPSWANPQGPPQAPADWHICDQAHEEAFGKFAAETVRFFDSWSKAYGVPPKIKAVEVGNEPNLYMFGGVPAARLRQLSNIAAFHIHANYLLGNYSYPPSSPNPIRVISGGLAAVGAISGTGPYPNYPFRPDWKNYLQELVGGGYNINFDVGIHPYETEKPPSGVVGGWASEGSSPFSDGSKALQYGVWQANQIKATYYEAEAIVAANCSANLWVTETGTSSHSTWSVDVFQNSGYRQTWGQHIQGGVLSLVADYLRSRPRCRSMIVHRLYSDDSAEPVNGPFYRYGIYDPPLTPGGPRVEKVARASLTGAWS